MQPMKIRISIKTLIVTSFLALASCTESVEQTDTPPSLSPEMLVLDVEGASLEAKVWGTGEVVMAIPGLGADISYFDMVAPLIASAGFRVVALNQRGIGNSTGSLENPTMDMLAQDVANAIQALDVERAHLLGWAFGNRVARAVAQNHPQQISSVMLIAAGGLVAPSSEVMRAFRQLTDGQDIDEAARIKALRVSLYAPTSDIEALLAKVQPGTWPEARLAQQAANQATSIDLWWSGGIAPMLVIQGRHDVIAPAENGLALVEEFPDRTKLVWVEDAAHMMLIEQPEVVARNVVEYLHDLPGL
jgi:pimeloyl-ACP methyl ester carboxylesterase